jgi:hypothetical protein
MEASDINTLKTLFNSIRKVNENMTSLSIKMKLLGNGDIDIAYNLSSQGQKNKQEKAAEAVVKAPKKKSCLKEKKEN